jgi:UDP-N-acetylglucosamine--N-acetylmuramyl-(pentapeptide) pyrophosphoryl-undecaprenol N-acetylglucosamine transferase
MKILVTGAHFTTATAVIEQMQKRENIEITYVGRKTTLEGDKTVSVESKLLPGKNVKFIPIIAGRISRNFSIFAILSFIKIPIGFVHGFFILFKEKPDVVLSFGGYVAVPIVLWAWFFSIPIIIHEQTLEMGYANKICSIFADKVALSYLPKKMSKKSFLSGNPIRDIVINYRKYPLDKEYADLFKRAEKEKKKVILITGGNQGSHIINTTVEKCISELLKIAFVIHASGDNKFGDYQRLMKLNSKKYIVRKWIGQEWGHILNKVDLILGRAGMNTLSEANYFGKTVLAVPLPAKFKSEQEKNAEYFSKFASVEVMEQKNLSGKTLISKIKKIFMQDKFKKEKPIENFTFKDSAKKIAIETILLGLH